MSETAQELTTTSELASLAGITRKLTSLEKLSYKTKLSTARGILEKLIEKFQQAVDASVFR